MIDLDDREALIREALEQVREIAEAGRAGEPLRSIPKDADPNWGWLQTMWPVAVAVDVVLSRATVPDAATEGTFKKAEAFDKAVALSERRQTLLEEAEAERDAATAAVERWKGDYFIQKRAADKAEAERDAALAAIERVRAIHTPGKIIDVWGKSMSQADDFLVCEECTDPDNWWVAHPCPTIAALDGAPEPDNDDPCDVEVYSWDHYRPEQIDPYWIKCTALGKHDEHEDSHTGLKWRSGLPVEGESKP